MYNSLFEEPWWLDAVAPRQWGAVEISRGNAVVARLAYVKKRRYGLTILTQPPLTPWLGPWLRPSAAKRAKRLSEQKDLLMALIDQLPAYDLFSQNFHYSVDYWLPFYWRGFSQTTRYTYVIEDIADHEAVWAGLRENIRTDIRKAQRQVEVRDDLGLDVFLGLNAKVFTRQERRVPYDVEVVRRIDDACASRGCRRIFFAQDARGRVHAAVYIVWDDKSAYYLMGGSDPELRSSGATSLLLWEAIKFASSIVGRFDFEGSMIEPIERFFRSFGARPTPYFRVIGMSRRFRLLWCCHEMLRALKGGHPC